MKLSSLRERERELKIDGFERETSHLSLLHERCYRGESVDAHGQPSRGELFVGRLDEVLYARARGLVQGLGTRQRLHTRRVKIYTQTHTQKRLERYLSRKKILSLCSAEKREKPRRPSLYPLPDRHQTIFKGLDPTTTHFFLLNRGNKWSKKGRWDKKL